MGTQCHHQATFRYNLKKYLRKNCKQTNSTLTIMKKTIIITIITALANFFTASAQYSDDTPGNRMDADGNIVHHSMFEVAQYQFSDFDTFKESGCYGLGLVFTSFSHWGALHVGANANFSVNYGLNKGIGGCIVDFGPSARYDIVQNAFINIPVNVVYTKMWTDDNTGSSSSSKESSAWGMRIAPSLHFFLTDRFGLYLGPQVVFGFKSGEKTTFGGQLGISYAF